jgi:ribonuclease P protein component
MIKKGFRLKENEDFSKVFRFGKPFFFQSIGCKSMKTEGIETKIGFSFPKKLFPKASERNRVKRVFSHVVENRMEFVPKEQQLVFFYREKPGKVEYQDIDHAVSEIFSTIADYSYNK